MKFSTLLLLPFCLLYLTSCAQEIPNLEAQIGAALKAAPKADREGATVLGYDADGKVVTLREGTNHMICLADNPNQAGFSVAAYHKDLEPFMARGRELRAEGKDRAQIFDAREAEARAGTLKMPEKGATLHILSGKEATYEVATDQLSNATYRYVVYLPFATELSTGLSLEPAFPGSPWIMDPGTHKAHIMISPPNPAELEP
ncbi:MAG: hypothetical protein AAF927_26685 [Bacteroidota bacterium]